MLLLQDITVIMLNPFMPSGLFFPSSLNRVISNGSGVWLICIVTIFKAIHVFNAISVDPDQMPQSVVSDLGLHCLSMSLLWNARHK